MNNLADAVAAFAARVASMLGPTGMRIVARVNKYVTNPAQRFLAPRLRYMAVIEHRGRKSGRRYRTPVMALVEDGTLTVVLNYGAQSDWVRNVEAAGRATVIHRNTRFQLTSPRILPTDSPEVIARVRGVGGASRHVMQGILQPE
jgi:deazaflavin-dependent oxidoreductase (nitroreductase family)